MKQITSAIKQKYECTESSRNGSFVYKTVEFNMIYSLLSMISFVAIWALLGGPALTINSSKTTVSQKCQGAMEIQKYHGRTNQLTDWHGQVLETLAWLKTTILQILSCHCGIVRGAAPSLTSFSTNAGPPSHCATILLQFVWRRINWIFLNFSTQ